MPRKLTYIYKGVRKELPFSYSRHNDIYEAAAAAEGIDISNFLAMEEQVRMTSKGKHAVKDFRQKEFARMGFSEIKMVSEEDESPRT
ncbi:DUF2960 domain-containing protein [Thalassotalea mangrovi]|uniref:DUF2960 domain-containing protein n=1 Tax=Thalassotalea mangrovi TaxID=2572245 RepID=A0A4U1B9N6_9GAMM|nr:DUF2960 domain-containing protein [Thalassotalea mangrovi]TKB47104.1 DUF2960 domain-containing protein [Thalassotalea mangrovi]